MSFCWFCHDAALIVCANSGSGKAAQVCKAVALARLHRCANSGSGKTSQVCKAVALALLHRCADLAEPLSVIHVIAQDFDVLFVQSK